MTKHYYKIVAFLASFCIILPLIIILIWCFADSWKFPYILPQQISFRGLKEISQSKLLGVVISSVFISSVTGIISTIIGTLTARALVFYDFKLKRFIKFLNLLPLMIPAAAFVMGIHITFIRLGLSDTFIGVIIIHLICGLPYSVNILCDVTKSTGNKLEEQALSLGASPIRAFFEVSFFALMPGFVTSFCMTYIISFSQYFITLIIGGGAVQTLSTVMVPIIQSGDRTLASIYSAIFVFSTIILFVPISFINRKLSSGREIEFFR